MSSVTVIVVTGIGVVAAVWIWEKTYLGCVTALFTVLVSPVTGLVGEAAVDHRNADSLAGPGDKRGACLPVAGNQCAADYSAGPEPAGLEGQDRLL